MVKSNHLSQTMEEYSVSQSARRQNAEIPDHCCHSDPDYSTDRVEPGILNAFDCGNTAKTQKPYDNPDVEMVIPLALVQDQMGEKSKDSKHGRPSCDLNRAHQLRHGMVKWALRAIKALVGTRNRSPN
jgi:hypothetical protein